MTSISEPDDVVSALRALDADDDIDQIRRWCAAGEFCWLDLQNPDRRAVQTVGEALGLHPLAIEDTQEFDQRPKVDRHDDQVLIVYYGARPVDTCEIELVEVHVHISHSFVLTVHHDALPRLTTLYERRERSGIEDREALV